MVMVVDDAILRTSARTQLALKVAATTRDYSIYFLKVEHNLLSIRWRDKTTLLCQKINPNFSYLLSLKPRPIRLGTLLFGH